MTAARKGDVIVRVGFNQQQRQLIQRLRESSGRAELTDGEIVRNGFVRWLESEGWLMGGRRPTEEDR